MKYLKERKEICELVNDMFDRFMTNAVGGNVSLRVGENEVLITPSLMAEEKRCKLNPDDLILVDLDMNVIDGIGRVSREINMHCGILKRIPRVNACVHAHPKNLLVFACLEVPLPSVTEATRKYGIVEVLPYKKACSTELADAVVDYFAGKKEALDRSGMAVMLARHGVMSVGRTLSEAYNVIERLEANAYIVLCSSLVENNPILKVANVQQYFSPRLFITSSTEADSGE
ncbi:class II aldolase/adducin family protein [Thermoanaerobacterium sp. DL9XJH110]|uniref:class II aldolase/adducin family protein n=1 Tax=Thermoanaerobacterium sp. DL9XJH110 TaxID=3386643 RepID=UPI003BB746A7